MSLPAKNCNQPSEPPATRPSLCSARTPHVPQARRLPHTAEDGEELLIMPSLADVAGAFLAVIAVMVILVLLV